MGPPLLAFGVLKQEKQRQDRCTLPPLSPEGEPRPPPEAGGGGFLLNGLAYVG